MDTSQYFYRNIIFSKIGKEISLIDINNPSDKEKLDPWFGMVIQLADGQHTIDQFYIFIQNQYNGEIPSNLKTTIDSVIKRLIDSKFIVLTKEKTNLPYYLSMPYEMLDIDKAKKLLAEDRKKVN